MYIKTTLAAVAAAGLMALAVPQAANALPQTSGVKQLSQSNVEQARYYGGRRGYYRHRGYYGRRHYRRGSGFGIYLGL